MEPFYPKNIVRFFCSFASFRKGLNDFWWKYILHIFWSPCTCRILCKWHHLVAKIETNGVLALNFLFERILILFGWRLRDNWSFRCNTLAPLFLCFFKLFSLSTSVGFNEKKHLISKQLKSDVYFSLEGIMNCPLCIYLFMAELTRHTLHERPTSCREPSRL